MYDNSESKIAALKHPFRLSASGEIIRVSLTIFSGMSKNETNLKKKTVNFH